MANKFYEWCENNINYENATTFASDTERQNGFVAGTPAKANKVNTALRQANLVVCALTDILIPNDSTSSVDSSRSDLKTTLDTALTNKITEVSGIKRRYFTSVKNLFDFLDTLDTQRILSLKIVWGELEDLSYKNLSASYLSTMTGSYTTNSLPLEISSEILYCFHGFSNSFSYKTYFFRGGFEIEGVFSDFALKLQKNSNSTPAVYTGSLLVNGSGGDSQYNNVTHVITGIKTIDNNTDFEFYLYYI